MKIAMIGQKGIPATTGGVERHVEEIAKRLVMEGHQVTVFCRSTYSKSQPCEYEGICLKYIKTIKSKNLEAIVYSLKASILVLFHDYDIIHYHALGPATVSFIPRLFGRKVVVTVHGLDWQRDKWGKLAKAYLKFGEKASAWFALRIISVSENLRNYYIKKYHKNENDVIFIPNGVMIHPPIEPDEIRRFALEKDKYILFLARLVPEKGAHYLIKAYQRLDTDKKLVIAGGTSYTDVYFLQLKQMANDNPNIIFAGQVQGKLLMELYSNAYVYVLPSDVEGMPITLLEAMSYSRTCLTSDIPENLGIIKGEYGFSFRQADINELKLELEMLINNPEKVMEVGKKSLKEIENHYCWDNIINEIVVVYKNIKILDLKKNLYREVAGDEKPRRMA